MRKAENIAKRENKRDETEKTKQEKALQRKKKIVQRALQIKESSNSSFDELPSDIGSNEESDGEYLQSNLKKPVEKKVGEYVIFLYEGRLFPAVIISRAETSAAISAMQKSGRRWNWPQKIDKLDYEWKDVINHINELTKMSSTRDV